ncbi:MAG TPA: alanine racemase [Bacteriovoracaceae bacterium]|nr:alanine racemase [Bacteriovoracaceae bacterium]
MRHSSYLEIDLSLVHRNYELVKKLAPRTQVLGMVKSNAYGNGMTPVSEFLINECGLTTLGTATLGEALTLFNESPRLNARVLVFSDTEIQDEHCREAYLSYNITPVIHQCSDLDVMLTDPKMKKVPLVLKVNTGMNRLGMSAEELEPYLPRLKNRGVEHLLTHFAYSYMILKDGDKCHRQMDEFRRIKKMLTDAGVAVRETSVSNSGAIEQGFGVDETFVRPGLMLYGPPSVLDPIIWNGSQISRLVTKVLKTFTVKKGVPIGYGINVTSSDGFMAVIPMGYGDGLIAYGSGTTVKVNGCDGYIFGRINMDMAFLFFESAAAARIKTGDPVELWSHDNRMITDIALQNKTIPYQLMCGISGRVPRVYRTK